MMFYEKIIAGVVAVAMVGTIGVGVRKVSMREREILPAMEKVYLQTGAPQLAAAQTIPTAAEPPVIVAERDSIKVSIFMYHSFDETSKSAWSITPAELEADLQYIRDNGYQTVLLSDLVDYVAGTAVLPEKPVVLTFDDGYVNNLQTALPILEKYDACAVVSIIGSKVTEVQAGYTPSGDSWMNWDQLRQLDGSDRIELGFHTWDLHNWNENGRIGCTRLGYESDEDYYFTLRKDIVDFRETMRAQGIDVDDITCYTWPYGKRSKGATAVVRDAGFTCSLITSEGINTLVRFRPELLYDLTRYNRDTARPVSAVLK